MMVRKPLFINLSSRPAEAVHAAHSVIYQCVRAVSIALVKSTLKLLTVSFRGPIMPGDTYNRSDGSFRRFIQPREYCTTACKGMELGFQYRKKAKKYNLCLVIFHKLLYVRSSLHLVKHSWAQLSWHGCFNCTTPNKNKNDLVCRHLPIKAAMQCVVIMRRTDKF